MKRMSMVLVLLALLGPFAMAPPPCGADDFSGANHLTWITEDYYPYNFEQNGSVRGISPDLLRAIWKELGEDQQRIWVLPWARGYRTLLKTPGTVLFSMARTPEREDLFYWAGPIATARFALIGMKKSHIKMETIEDVQGYSVGTVREDVTDQLLAPYRNMTRIEQTESIETNLKKILRGRVDLVAYEETAFKRLLEKNDMAPDQFEAVFTLRETSVYYAFHKSTDTGYVTRFQNALDRIEKTPLYQAILDKYTQ